MKGPSKLLAYACYGSGEFEGRRDLCLLKFLIRVSALTSLRHQRRAVHLRGARILSNFLTNVLPPRLLESALRAWNFVCLFCLPAFLSACLRPSPRRTLSNLLTHVLPRRLLECALSDWPPQTSRVRAKCLEHCVSLLSAWPPVCLCHGSHGHGGSHSRHQRGCNMRIGV